MPAKNAESQIEETSKKSECPTKKETRPSNKNKQDQDEPANVELAALGTFKKHSPIGRRFDCS
jgi:hypothetical protein